LRRARRNLFIAAQWLFAAAIIWYAARALQGQWDTAATRLATLDISWSLIGIATAIVVGTYFLLIDAWRRIVTASGQPFRFADAARIWFVSNLGKYIPGKVWSIAAMTVMARERGVTPVTAAGSSLLVQLVSVATGIGVLLVAGAQTLREPLAAAIAGIAIAVGILMIPAMVPLIGKIINAVTGRSVTLPAMSARTIWEAAARAAISWIAYGIAFQIFVAATLGSAAGATTSYIAVYAASYIIGFLALFAPGGAVVRESAVITGMLRLGLSSEADALAVAVASRLWLTATELLPGLAYLALGKRVARIQ